MALWHGRQWKSHQEWEKESCYQFLWDVYKASETDRKILTAGSVGRGLETPQIFLSVKYPISAATIPLDFLKWDRGTGQNCWGTEKTIIENERKPQKCSLCLKVVLLFGFCCAFIHTSAVALWMEMTVCHVVGPSLWSISQPKGWTVMKFGSWQWILLTLLMPWLFLLRHNVIDVYSFEWNVITVCYWMDCYQIWYTFMFPSDELYKSVVSPKFFIRSKFSCVCVN